MFHITMNFLDLLGIALIALAVVIAIFAELRK